MVRPYRRNRTEEDEIKDEFRISFLESSRERAVKDLGFAMTQTSHRLALIRDRIAELEAMPWKDVVHVRRGTEGCVTIWVDIFHVPILDGQPSFEDGYTIDRLGEDGNRFNSRHWGGTDRHVAFRFAEQVARERDLDLYFEGFHGQKVKTPEGIVCWGLPS